MLSALKRIFFNNKRQRYAAAQAWADSHEYTFKHIRDQDGFVIEGKLHGHDCRVEWGNSRRPYIKGHELRIMVQNALPSSMLALLSTRMLMTEMEKTVFEQFTGAVQTRADLNTPEEMRWLVMLPKVAGPDMSPLRQHWGALSSDLPWMTQWLGSAVFEEQLNKMAQQAQATMAPIVWVAMRGKLTLRTALTTVDAATLEQWFGLFEASVHSALHIWTPAADHAPLAEASTSPALWVPSQMPTLPMPAPDGEHNQNANPSSSRTLA